MERLTATCACVSSTHKAATAGEKHTTVYGRIEGAGRNGDRERTASQECAVQRAQECSPLSGLTNRALPTPLGYGPAGRQEKEDRCEVADGRLLSC
ncbi:hypothetical protein JTB14_026795 [Gonioctena quinquepunctata]|nr:hypothetical protein JTB14_026795 [Gonioctena quinquepunctata]